MSQAGHPDEERILRAFEEFFEYLDDQKPALFVAESLSIVLRTDPPVYIGTGRVVDLVVQWAESRVSSTGRARGDLMLAATTHIIDAYRTNSVEGLNPKDFYRPFVSGLTARVPVEERDQFQEGLRQLQSAISQRWNPKAEKEYDQTDGIKLRGVSMTRQQALEALIDLLESSPTMSDADFDQTIAELDEVLSSRAELHIHTGLGSLVKVAVWLFKSSQVARAGRLLTLVEDVFDRLNIAPDRQLEIRKTVSSSDLDMEVFTRWVTSPARHTEIAPVLRFFPDLRPQTLLHALALGARPERRRALLGAIDVQGGAALEPVLEQLQHVEAQKGDADWLRTLITLAGRAGRERESDRRRAVAAIGPFATSEKLEFRLAALAGLKNLGGREVIPFAMRALDPSNYRALSTDQEDMLKHMLRQALEILVESESESPPAVVAEFAVGTRGNEFGLGRALRDVAIEVLAKLPQLPIRAEAVIVAHLRQLIARKFKFMIGNISIGVDVPSVRALMGLLTHSEDPEVNKLLAEPILKKIATKGNTGMLAPS